jgi:hypothetical protein
VTASPVDREALTGEPLRDAPLPSLPLAGAVDRPDEIDLVARVWLRARFRALVRWCAGIARVDAVQRWEQVALSQRRLHGEQLLDIMDGSESGVDLDDEVRRLRIAGLGHMRLVPDPGAAALEGIDSVPRARRGTPPCHSPWAALLGHTARIPHLVAA